MFFFNLLDSLDSYQSLNRLPYESYEIRTVGFSPFLSPDHVRVTN